MKTRNIIAVALFLLMIGSISANATDSQAEINAMNQLEKDIHSVIRYVPFNDIIGDADCCTVDLIFRVNESAQVVDYSVSGKNARLVSWVKSKLEASNLISNSVLAGQKCHVILSFKNGATIF
ncbi:MAG: hypothetical protein JW801_02920 [Bacteroidales bacterium]|nr:hypothetical protein [Bacteroidales bacterium]